jgi:hypothetical protein
MEVSPKGVDKVLELVGATTLKDSPPCAEQRGIVCITGIVGNKWSFDNFAPISHREERNCRCFSTLTVLRVPTGQPKPSPVSPREGLTDGLTGLARAFAR